MCKYCTAIRSTWYKTMKKQKKEMTAVNSKLTVTNLNKKLIKTLSWSWKHVFSFMIMKPGFKKNYFHVNSSSKGEGNAFVTQMVIESQRATQ